ncbi:MAG TPA: hypothetical protein VNI77_06820 [Nitrososphaera sp.]|nr:hypothetical protein [Nitrososphaera sp.]
MERQPAYSGKLIEALKRRRAVDEAIAPIDVDPPLERDSGSPVMDAAVGEVRYSFPVRERRGYGIYPKRAASRCSQRAGSNKETPTRLHRL